METSPSIKAIMTALSQVQGQISPAKPNQVNPFFKMRYADLAAAWESCRKVLVENGLAVVQVTDEINGHLFLETVLGHTSGEWIKGRLPITPVKNDLQGLGSALTYARRYAMAALIGITVEGEDDDAEVSMDRTTPATPLKDSRDRRRTPVPAPPSPAAVPPAPAPSERERMVGDGTAPQVRQEQAPGATGSAPARELRGRFATVGQFWGAVQSAGWPRGEVDHILGGSLGAFLNADRTRTWDDAYEFLEQTFAVIRWAQRAHKEERQAQGDLPAAEATLELHEDSADVFLPVGHLPLESQTSDTPAVGACPHCGAAIGHGVQQTLKGGQEPRWICPKCKGLLPAPAWGA